jgi:GTP-binding protein
MAQAGDIVVLAGVPMEAVGVSDTVADFAVTEPLPTVPVTPPTICMSFGANDGPLSGKGGGVFLNSSQVSSYKKKKKTEKKKKK